MAKKRVLLIFALLSFFALLPGTVLAFSVKTGDSVYFGKDEKIEGNLYAAGMNIVVDGSVSGDLVCAGQNITVNGNVEGSVICAGQSIQVNGKVGGDTRLAGNSLTVNGMIDRGAMLFGSSVSVSKDAVFGWDVFVAGAVVDMRGRIGRSLHGAASSLMIGGKVAGDVAFRMGNGDSSNSKPRLTINKDAEIGGNLSYADWSDALIEDGAKIGGEVTRNEPKNIKESRAAFPWLWGIIFSIFASLVTGLVFISIWRKTSIIATDLMLVKAGPSIGWGLLIMLLTPMIILVLLITIIGIPLALIMAGAWLALLYLGKIAVSILVGRSIIEKFWHTKNYSLIWAMIVGVILVQLFCALPLIGVAISFIATWWGSGGLFIVIREATKKSY